MDGLRAAVVAFVSGPFMIEGGLTALLYIDDDATTAQEEALTGIVSRT